MVEISVGGGGGGDDATLLSPGPHTTIFATIADLREPLQQFAAPLQEARTSPAASVTSSDLSTTPNGRFPPDRLAKLPSRFAPPSTYFLQHLRSLHPWVDFTKAPFPLLFLLTLLSESQSLADSAAGALVPFLALYDTQTILLSIHSESLNLFGL
ncbi:hypothetical protein NUW54_g268 [Trametes sanguinea]|uniref:Uncharacterized protein n=1 Tax=Trametes sanguinea TaxID=158606 RepID=A0ACC1QB37_9APHY|nr:hypothetical protein NUW54_g268 [Trametes sanguinea]